jgi:hypothetical protein
MIRFALLLSVVTLVFASGCSDTAHLRPVPDYKNMTDSGDDPT